jgi:hypothetical protein
MSSLYNEMDFANIHVPLKYHEMVMNIFHAIDIDNLKGFHNDLQIMMNEDSNHDSYEYLSALFKCRDIINNYKITINDEELGNILAKSRDVIIYETFNLFHSLITASESNFSII